MIKEGRWIQYVPSRCLFLSLILSHPVMAWTVVELRLLGSVVDQIVSWLTHHEGGKERRVRGEKAAGIKAATGEVGGRMREGDRGTLHPWWELRTTRLLQSTIQPALSSAPCPPYCMQNHLSRQRETCDSLMHADYGKVKFSQHAQVLHLILPCSALPSTQN